MNYLNMPLSIGKIQLKNRLVMPPMATAKSSNGKVTHALLDYYNEKSSGGYIGLIITEHCYISIEGKAGTNQLSIAEDSDIEGLKALTDCIHQNQTKVFAQISHAGMQAKEEITGCKAIAPSATFNPRKSDSPIPQEMSIEQIQTIKEKFVKAAIRAQKAGFDGVEIHSAHGYLLNQFYSPLINQRKDDYGGTIENRIRLHLEIIQAIKKQCGKHYPVAIRLGACDYMENGSTLEDAIFACIAFEKAGVDLIDISGGFHGYIHPTNFQQGYFSEVTEALKKSLHIPVLLTGGIVDKEAAEMLLKENKADCIGVGRAILKNSSWSKDAIEAQTILK